MQASAACVQARFIALKLNTITRALIYLDFCLGGIKCSFLHLKNNTPI